MQHSAHTAMINTSYRRKDERNAPSGSAPWAPQGTTKPLNMSCLGLLPRPRRPHVPTIVSSIAIPIELSQVLLLPAKRPLEPCVASREVLTTASWVLQPLDGAVTVAARGRPSVWMILQILTLLADNARWRAMERMHVEGGIHVKMGVRESKLEIFRGWWFLCQQLY